MGTKLKDILKESVLGELPSSKMFKYNKATGKYEAPGQHTNEDMNVDALPKTTIPSDVKLKLEKLLQAVDGNKLTLQQKIQMIAKLISELEIDKSQLNTIASKLKSISK